MAHNDVDSDPKPKTSLIETVFPQQESVVFFTAIVCGFLLLAAAFARRFLDLDGVQSNLLISVGVGLILAAFGGQAKVDLKWVVMAGVAGIALGLFIVLQNYSQNLFVVGSIRHFDKSKYDQVNLRHKSNVLGAVRPDVTSPANSVYDFVIFRRDLDQRFVEVTVTKSVNKEETNLRVGVAKFESAFSTSSRLEWDLRSVVTDGQTHLEIYDFDGKKISESDDRVALDDLPRPSLFSIAALAQDQSRVNLENALLLLKDNDLAVRKAARDTLSSATNDQIPRIAQALKDQYSDYQVRLGIVVAFTQMLRNDKSRRGAIGQALTDDDMNRILDAAADDDRTVRIYATEFLYDLGSPRAASLAIQRAAAAPSDNARYNWIFSSQDGWQRLAADQKKFLIPVLLELQKPETAKLNELIRKFM